MPQLWRYKQNMKGTIGNYLGYLIISCIYVLHADEEATIVR